MSIIKGNETTMTLIDRCKSSSFTQINIDSFTQINKLHFFNVSLSPNDLPLV